VDLDFRERSSGSKFGAGRIGTAIALAFGLLVLLAATASAVALHTLTPKGCIADTGDTAGCGATAQGLNAASGAAVSPEGASVYAASGLDDAIVRFDRAADGALSNPSCISDVGDPAGCGATAQGLNSVSGIAVSPDGASVYGISFLDDAIVRFDRAADGALSNPSCISDVGDPAGCGATAQGLNGASSVAVSPDGASVYAVSGVDDAIVRFDRAASGALSNPSCISDVGDAAGCGATAQGLDAATGVAVSPDGASVYAASISDDATVRFDRAANGALSNGSCIADPPDTTGCGATAQGLLGAGGIAVSPDGANVYAVSQGDQAFVRLDRAPNGALSNPSCIADPPDSAGCGATTQGLNGASGVALSPDGGSVYAVSFTDSAIVRLAREVPPVCRTSSSTGAPGAQQTVPLDCFEPNGDPMTIEITKQPSQGTLGAVNQGAKTVAYTPNGGFSGADLFEIRATAGSHQSNIATVVVGVQSATGPPGPPGPPGASVIELLVALAATQGQKFTAGKQVSLTYVSTAAGSATLTITRNSEKVAEINGPTAKGENTIAWDGKADGKKAKPGAYTAELTVSSSDGQQATDSAQLQLKKKKKKK
jgi:DNA-binding beta-propeller fold protein YncE